MKAFVQDFNNVLMELSNRVETTSNPREADVIILWQDVRGSYESFVKIIHDYCEKPIIVVQHGRGATRDYLPPNNFKLIADKICVWGQKEADRMIKAGYGDKTIITGSPLVHYTRKPDRRIEVDKKVVVFTPIIAQQERPENLEVYYTLKQMEFEYMKKQLKDHEDNLKISWNAWSIDEKFATEGTIPVEIMTRNFFVVAKTTDIHDNKLYIGTRVQTNVTHALHLKNSSILLQNSDLIVGLEEGTFHLMAQALNIPTVIVDNFKYGNFGGVANYDQCEIIRTEASAFCDLKDLERTIKEELENKNKRQQARKRVVEDEFDPFPDKDPIELIIDVASELAGGDIRLKSNQEVLNVNS